MNLFKSNWSKWQILGNYRFSTTDYVVFAKTNKKTGLMKFKTVPIHSLFYQKNNIINFKLDVEKNWNEITQGLK
jgi:hypothetical protein